MKEIYVLYFNEWGWEEGEEQHGEILGVFTDYKTASEFKTSAKTKNDHGYYDIKKVTLNKFSTYGW